MRKINYALGISYFLIIFVAYIIRMAFPFEILQEVIITDHRNNYALSKIIGTVVGLMMMFALGHLGFMIGVATTEESLKKV